VLPEEGLELDPGVELDRARPVVRVLPDLLQGGPAVLPLVPPEVEGRDGVPGLDEDEPLGGLAVRDTDRPDVPAERVLLQVEEEGLQCVRAARDAADDLAFRENGKRRGLSLIRILGNSIK